MRAAPVLALTALLLAGCVAPPPAAPSEPQPLAGLSEKRFDLLPPEEVWVPSSADGKRMNNALYRPDTTEPVPVFINFSPYWGDTAMTEGDHFSAYMIHEYVPRGYAVVLSSVRGTGHSEGCFQISGDLEVQDAHDVVDHFSKAPWANGNVGAGGKSYDSTTQNGLLAKMPHPALKTLFHVSGITDWYRYVYRNGVPYSIPSGFNTYYGLGQGLDEYGLGGLGTGGGTSDDEDPESIARLVDDLACPELAKETASGFGTGLHGLKDAYWQERDWNRDIASSAANTSIFFVHGLQDWNVKPDHILPWLQLLPPGTEVKGWLHQWTRQPEGGHVYPMRTDWNATMLRWLDHYLKGLDTGIERELGFEAMGSDGVWRASAAWPPAEAVATDFPLTLQAASATLESATPLRASGIATLNITAVNVGPDPVLTAVLHDVAPNGTRTWLNEAVLRAAYRGGLETPAPLLPQQALAYALEFYPMDAVLQPGHQWVVTVGIMPEMASPLQAQLEGVQYSADATLTLPVPPLLATATQPEAMDCFAC